MLPTNTAYQYKAGTYQYSAARAQDMRNTGTNSDTARRRYLEKASIDQKIAYWNEEADSFERMVSVVPAFFNVASSILITGFAANCDIGLVGPGCMVGVSSLLIAGNCWCLRSLSDNRRTEERRISIASAHIKSACVNAGMLVVNVVALSILAGINNC